MPKDYHIQLENAAKKQKFANFYDCHLHLPLTNTEPQPYGTSRGAKTTNLSIRLPAEIKEHLEGISSETGYSVNEMVRNAIIYAVALQKDRAEAAAIYANHYSSMPPVSN